MEVFRVLCAGLLLSACGAAPTPNTRPDEEARSGLRVGMVPADATPVAGEAEVTIANSRPPADFEQHAADVDWRDRLTPQDRRAMDELKETWGQAAEEAYGAGHGAELHALGAAAEPAAGLPILNEPPQADYVCRVSHIGSRTNGLAFITYPSFTCRIERTPEGRLQFTKMTGSQRTQGLLYRISASRMLYVGGQAWGAGDRRFPLYGDIHERDHFGLLEQLGDNHWRIVMPAPRQAQRLEIMEFWAPPQF